MERTLNIWLMSVTPEVSQLEMSALKSSKDGGGGGRDVTPYPW